MLVFILRVILRFIMYLLSLLFLQISRQNVIILSWRMYNHFSFNMSFSFILDITSSIFALAVSIISFSVFVYSFDYIKIEKSFIRFHLTLISFVVSMIFLIFRVNTLAILLGWDGLGVTSYLLVIFYQRPKSYNAGILTALINRVGDVFLLITCGLSFIERSVLFSISSYSQVSHWSSLGLFCFLARLTKRAQIPFSAWLPAAIAAPTPVSALVHSSTLVTAGVYLMIRFRVSLFNSSFSLILLFLGTCTIVIAGSSALKENDMKKVVALSTLRQLGLIITSLALGFVTITFFHLITHAFMKALLFIAIGDAIHLSKGYQDSRKIEIFINRFPLRGFFLIRSNFGLIGLPFLSGFYSKDMWIEFRSNSYIRFIFMISFILGIVLTCIYSLKIINSLFTSNSSTEALSVQIERLNSRLTKVILWSFSLIRGRALFKVLFFPPKLVFLIIRVKLLTIDLILFTFFYLFVFSYFNTLNSSWFFFNIWGASYISTIWAIKYSRVFRFINRKLYDLMWVEMLITRVPYERGIISQFFSLEAPFLKRFKIIIFLSTFFIFLI